MKQHRGGSQDSVRSEGLADPAAPGRRSLTDQLDQASATATGDVPHRDAMEASFGTSFAGVSAAVGTPEARSTLDRAGANAATIGNKVLFADSSPSRELVGHELAHTIQQGAVSGRAEGAGGDAEREAHGAGNAAAAGGRAVVHGRSTLGVPQFDLRDTASGARNQARQQHDARGNNPAAGPAFGTPHSFSDMAEDDRGPALRHDHGFLDDGHGNIDESKRQEATWGDHLERMKWIAKLEGAELLRPDLVDGTSAYRHFLFGNGATRDVHYERFISGDNAGQLVVQSAMADARDAAIRRHDQDLAGRPPEAGSHSYHIRTGVVSVGGGDGRYPYPTTENWQKAIGAHSIWIEANVTVNVRAVEGGGFERQFHVDMTIHAEDMYNFNPGAADIATGTPDAANGRFEVTGLGREYLNQGTYARPFDFTTTMAPAPAPTPGDNSGGPAVEPGRAPGNGRAEGGRGRPTER